MLQLTKHFPVLAIVLLFFFLILPGVLVNLYNSHTGVQHNMHFWETFNFRKLAVQSSRWPLVRAVLSAVSEKPFCVTDLWGHAEVTVRWPRCRCIAQNWALCLLASSFVPVSTRIGKELEYLKQYFMHRLDFPSKSMGKFLQLQLAGRAAVTNSFPL